MWLVDLNNNIYTTKEEQKKDQLILIYKRFV